MLVRPLFVTNVVVTLLRITVRQRAAFGARVAGVVLLRELEHGAVHVVSARHVDEDQPAVLAGGW